MRKLFISVAVILSTAFVSCDDAKYDKDFMTVEMSEENADERYFLERCVRTAFLVHDWMSEEENLCSYYDCCWEYVPKTLRDKYENNLPLSVNELNEIISWLETSPSFMDTLAEYDEFIDLDYFREFGIGWFNPQCDED